MEKYFYAIGRRKESTATVRLFEGKGSSMVNDKPLETVYPLASEKKRLFTPLMVLEKLDNFYFTAKSKGGGKKGQLEAIVLGLSRALVKFDADFKTILKPHGLMTRDDRIVERKKTGRVKARKSPQFSKR